MAYPDRMNQLERVRAYRTGPDEPILVCTPATLRVPAPVEGLEVVVVGSDSPLADIRETMDVNERGFDPAAEAVPDDAAEAFRAELVGCSAITLRYDGVGVAAGMHLPIREGVTELTGIATVTEYRNRGFGTAATAALCRIAFAGGADLICLTTDNPVAQRVYERLGFAPPE